MLIARIKNGARVFPEAFPPVAGTEPVGAQVGYTWGLLFTDEPTEEPTTSRPTGQPRIRPPKLADSCQRDCEGE